MTLRVLVVDDEPLARERLSHLVEELAGRRAAGEAASGEEALLLAPRRLKPDVVLLDIRMPGMDGLEAAHHLARCPNRRQSSSRPPMNSMRSRRSMPRRPATC